MALTVEFASVSSNLKAGYGVFGTADPYNATALNNGAKNPLGSLYFVPSASMGGNTILGSAAGYAAGLWVKYVLYKSTYNPAMVAGPAPVVYTDTTFTTVSGQFSESFVASNSTYTAGWLLPNTGSVAGVGVGTAITATILNNGGLGSYVWIGVMGFIPSAYLAAGAAGNFLYMTGNFSTTGIAEGTSQPWRGCGYSWGTVSSNIGDVLATVIPF